MTEKQIQRLLKIAGNVFDVDPLKKTRQRDHVQARMIVMKILRDKGYSFSRVAKVLNLNHSSIIHLLQMAQGNNIIYQLSHDDLIKYTFSLEERLKKIILSNNRNKNYENLFKFIERNIPESNLIEAKQRLKDLTDGLYN